MPLFRLIITFARRRLLLCLVITFGICAACIMHDGLSDQIQPCDVGIVLASKVNADGTVSESLAARMNKAIELYRAGVFAHIIVSGGVGCGGYNEADVMRAYMLQMGVPDSAILMDGTGKNTHATAEDSAELMRRHGYRTAMVITQYFHVPRARYALHRCGVAQVYQAHANLFAMHDFYSLSREVVAYGWYVLRG